MFLNSPTPVATKALALCGPYLERLLSMPQSHPAHCAAPLPVFTIAHAAGQVWHCSYKATAIFIVQGLNNNRI
jgi:hypothetical protein